MSLFDEDTPPVIPEADPIQIQEVSPSMNIESIDTRYQPAASLMTHVEGMSWTLDAYYSQVLNTDTPLKGQQLNLSPRLQQYTLIKNLEIKVTQDLKPVPDTSTNEMVNTGNANIFGGLKPNVGDMFIAQNTDGRQCVFKITQSDKKSMLKNAVYTVEYQMVYFAEQVYLDDFIAKTVRTVVFISDYINYGENPFLQEEAFDILRTLSDLNNSVMYLYFRSFLSTEYSTMILPGQEISIYDHFLTKAIQSVFSTWDAPEVRGIRRMNVDDDTTIAQGTSIWDVVIQKDRFILKECIKRVGGVYARRFTNQPMLEGFRYSGIKAAVYPIDPVTSFDYQRSDTQKLIDEDIVLKPTMVIPPPPEGATTPPLIKTVTVDNYYVLSQAFYDKTETGQSQLEIQVNAYLEGKALDNRVLVQLAEQYTGWGGLERFYYGALLMILIKATIRSI